MGVHRGGEGAYDGAMENTPFTATIEAGADAFGSGAHATTQCALALMGRLPGGYARVLDMGCGAGVLAIYAAKRWGSLVMAVDVQESAVEAARANMAANGVADKVTVCRSNGYGAPQVAAGAPYEVVLCNVLAEPIVAWADDLARHLAPGGVAVLAGILRWQEQAVRQVHEAAGLAAEGRVQVGDWVGLTFRMPQ